jgi:GH24 family phage-related lysozyme (muramidase)
VTAPLRARVLAVWWSFSARFEGVVDHCYLDVRRLVTIGVGNLIDPRERALALPFVWRGSGRPATRIDIEAEWDALKHHRDAARIARLGAGEAAKVCQLRLEPPALRQLVQARLDANVAHLARRWPAFWSWPAPAQLALCSWAWAGGPGQPFPKMSAHLAREDFAAAAEEIRLNDTDNPGLTPRNAANRALLLQASTATDPEALVLPWEQPPEQHHPALPEPDRGAVLALVHATLWRSSWDAMLEDRAERDRLGAD